MPEPSQRRRDRFKKLALMLSSTLMAFGILETASRVRQYVRYGSAKTGLYTTVVDSATGLPIPQPNQVAGPIRINSRGFRGPELAVPKPPGRIRLAFLGGSTTFCAELSSNEATWPHLVWKELQTRWPELQFDYVNAGVPGYTVVDSLQNLKYRVSPLRPDVIVIYEAINDLSLDTRVLANQQGLIKGKPENPSWMARHSLAWFLVEKNLEILFRERRGAAETHHLVFDPKKLGQAFHDRMLQLVEASKQTAPIVAIATFSHRVRRDQSHDEQVRACISSFYYMPYMNAEGILTGIEEYNRQIREVARQSGAILVNGENSIPGNDKYFHDSVHFTDAGSEQMARRVAQGLIDSAEFQRLIAWRLAGERESRLREQNTERIQVSAPRLQRLSSAHTGREPSR